jgi:hypothetical protein
VSVPTAELTAPAVAPERGAASAVLERRFRGGQLYLTLAVAALAIGALSLLLPSTPSYDPWAWLVWGREIVHINLHTTGGPTWKPLPVIFTTVFALFGKVAPNLWLVVARAGGVMTVFMVFKVALRLTRQLRRAEPVEVAAGAPARDPSLLPGVLAGAIAVVTLAFSGGFLSDTALGYSEGLLTVFVLIAVDRHLDGRYRQAFAFGFLAALDRPEIWLFWGPYGLWLWWRDPEARRMVLGLFALIPVLWFLPEYWGSGHFLRGVSRAHTPRSNSAAFAKCPFCSELVKHAWPTVLLRVKVAAALAVGGAAALVWRAHKTWRLWQLRGPRDRALVALVMAGVFGLVWWILIALLTQAGFSGNDRYLVLGAALIDIAGGVGWGWAALELGGVIGRRLDRAADGADGADGAYGADGADGADGAARPVVRWGAVALGVLGFAFLPNFVGPNLIDVQRTHRALVYQAHLRQDAARAVRELGGPARVLACGSVMTEGFQVPMVAWTLGVHTLQVEASPLPGQAIPPAPNVIFQTRAQRHASLLPRVRDWSRVVPYQLVAHARTFKVYSHCAGKVTL